MTEPLVFYSLYKLFLIILGGILIRLIFFPLLPPSLQESFKKLSEAYIHNVRALLKKISASEQESIDDKLLFEFLTPLSLLLVGFAFLTQRVFLLPGYYTIKYALLLVFTGIFIFLLPSQEQIQDGLKNTSTWELNFFLLKVLGVISLLFMVPTIPAWMSLSMVFLPAPSLSFPSFSSSVELLQ